MVYSCNTKKFTRPTQEFKPIDLKVNGVANEFLSNKFGDWYAKQITYELEKGTDAYKIDVNTMLTVMKPVHTKWVVYITTCEILLILSQRDLKRLA